MKKPLKAFFFILAFALNTFSSCNHNCSTENDNLSNEKVEQQKTILRSNKEGIDSNFLSFWGIFLYVVKRKDLNGFKAMCLDSLEGVHKNVHVNVFIKSYFTEVFNNTLFLSVSDKDNIDFINVSLDCAYFSPFVLKQLKNRRCVVKEVNITIGYNSIGGPVFFTLTFIETSAGYKFFGYSRAG